MSETAPGRSLRLELLCFAALACFAALNWAALVHDPPVLRTLAAVAVATAAAGLLCGLARWPSGRARWAVVAAATVATVCLAMVVVGLPARMLLPGHWDELGGRLAGSLDGIATVPVPYGGGDWTRLTILLAAPVLVGLAAIAAFWPGPRRRWGRLAALVLLVGLYLVAIAWRAPGGDLGQGLLLLVLVGAWLWLPAAGSLRLGAAAAVVAATAVAAVPLSIAVDQGRPLLDYRNWALFGGGGVGFDWNHSYGPLDWPQRGTLLLTVASDGPHYWKVTNLDTFDGTGWIRSPRPAEEPVLGEPSSLKGPAARKLGPTNPWVDRINFDVHGLRSDLVVGAGTTLRVQDPDAVASPDAIWRRPEALNDTDSYTVLAYTPDPTPSQARNAGTAYPAAVRRYASLRIATGDGATADLPGHLWGEPGGATASAFAGTPYEDTYRLARRITRGAGTPYDAATAIELHLRRNYAYRQDVPDHHYPLPAFLFEDRAGYCQQFSGAMALMLRMVGVPARVASGFAPGGRDPERGTFLVKDLDAHSWVEVFFPRIGWVTFEPTPPLAPAEAQLDDHAIGTTDSGEGPGFSQAPGPERVESSSDASGRVGPHSLDGTTGSGPSGPRPVEMLGIAALVLAGIAALTYLARTIRRRRLDPGALAEAELRELERALGRLGWGVRAKTTLVELERALAKWAGPSAAAYAARLRERRYRDPGAAPPGPEQRRALRRALLAASGRRALLAIPPGGPRRRG